MVALILFLSAVYDLVDNDDVMLWIENEYNNNRFTIIVDFYTYAEKLHHTVFCCYCALHNFTVEREMKMHKKW